MDNPDPLMKPKLELLYNGGETATLPGTLVRIEGGPATADADVNNAYTFLGDTYNYYLTVHGRDSVDNAGLPLIATVHHCESSQPCPLQNAFWNGTQMVFGDGFASADDVTAHELTHGVTQYSANLFYYMQSGTLNESFSDIFGESVDLTNSHGTDTPAVRWLLGEDIPGFGAIRNMMNPQQFGDPGKISDAQFRCTSGDAQNDNGGVHHNSGVPNHAYALMVDGGTYNGFTIAGIGLTKAAKVQYRALTRYLVSGSNFLDNYNVLQQSCADLIGTAGITSADCVEVKKALDAVEMFKTPCAQPQEPALCVAGQTPTPLFFDDAESGGSNWQFGTLWSRLTNPQFARSGTASFYGNNIATPADSQLTLNRDIAIPASGARLQFSHSFEFEPNFDGGVIEYSTNGGTSWTDAGSLIVAGAQYNTTLSTRFGNPLGGRQAFSLPSFGYTATQLNLTSLTGQNVRFRFRIGTDSSVGNIGWLIDDVRVYQCLGPSTTPTGVNISAHTFTDVNGDGRADMVWCNTPTGQVAVWLFNGPTSISGALVGSAVDNAWQIVGKADLDGDGNGDLVWRHTQTGDVAVWFLNGQILLGGAVVASGVPLAWETQ
jgi:hypothetical protein